MCFPQGSNLCGPGEGEPCWLARLTLGTFQQCHLCKLLCLLNLPTMLLDFTVSAFVGQNILVPSNITPHLLLTWLDSSSKAACMRQIQRKSRNSKTMQREDL